MQFPGLAVQEAPELVSDCCRDVLCTYYSRKEVAYMPQDQETLEKELRHQMREGRAPLIGSLSMVV